MDVGDGCVGDRVDFDGNGFGFSNFKLFTEVVFEGGDFIFADVEVGDVLFLDAAAESVVDVVLLSRLDELIKFIVSKGGAKEVAVLVVEEPFDLIERVD